MVNEPERPEWATRIRDFRKAKGMSQAALAKAAGISLGYMGLIELGERNPSASVVNDIADALGLSAKKRSDLLGAIPREERKLTIPQRLDRLEEAFAQLVERLDDGLEP